MSLEETPGTRASRIARAGAEQRRVGREKRARRSYTRDEVLELMELASRRDLDREGSFEELLDWYPRRS